MRAVLVASLLSLASLASLIACRDAPPAPPPAVAHTVDLPVGSNAPASSAPPPPPADAGAAHPRLPAELAHLVEPKEQRVLLGPFMWPPKGTSAFVGQLSLSLVWKNDRAEDLNALPTDRTPTRAITKDVDGDGIPELVAFIAPITRPLESYEDRSTLWLYTVRPADGRVVRMSVLEYQVIGANDERTLDTELASLGKLGPTANVPAERIITRLPWATADELKALVPAQGVRECHRQAMRRTCNTVARAAIDAKTTKRLVTKPGAFAKYETDDMTALQRPSCEEKAKKGTSTTTITCGASVGGPEGGAWVFERRGADLELVEIGSWAEDS